MISDALPSVSVVVPAFNYARYVSEAISSLLKQDYPNLEIIVIDDGSTDDTSTILRQFSHRVRCERQANVGQSETLNRGWNRSRGSILGYLSADDVLYPSAVTDAVEALSTHKDAVACYPDFDLIDSYSNRIRSVRRPDFSLDALIGKVECLPGPGAFFRRDSWLLAGPWDTTLRQMADYDFWMRLALQGPLLRIPRVLAAFRVHETSQTFSTIDAPRAQEPVRIVERFFAKEHLSDAVLALRSKALANASLLSAQLHARAGRWRMAAYQVRDAFRLAPSEVFQPLSARRMLNALINRTGHRIHRTLTRVLRAAA